MKHKLLILLLFTPTLIFSQSSSFHFYESFSILKNLDSLEIAVGAKRAQPHNYLAGLICLEKSRHAYQSEKFGRDLQKIQELAFQQKNPLAIATGQLLIGTYEIRNEVSKATPPIIAATQYFENIRDTTALLLCYSLIISINKSPGTTAIGSPTEQVRGSLENIEIYYRKIRALGEQSRSILDKIICLQTIISYHSLVQKATSLVEEKRAINEAIALINKHPEYEYLRVVIYNRAVTLYQNAHQYKKALTYELACYQMNDNQQKAIFNNNLSYSYQLIEDYTHAEIYAEKAVALIKNSQDLDLKIAVHYLLSDAKYGLKKYEEAWNNKAIADSLYQINEKKITDKTYLELQTKYETEKKQQANQELSKQQQRLYTYLFIGVFVMIVFVIILFRLRSANIHIKELMKHRDQFYTIVAHDLRAPIGTLTEIGGVIRFLVNQNRTEDLNKVINRIDSVSAETSLLLNNLIEWGKINNYKVVTQQQVFDAAQVIHELYNSHKTLAETKGIALSIAIPEQLEVITDPKSFSLILRNLLDNARKFTSTGGSIKVFSEHHNHQVFIYVQDSGQGIHPEQLDYIQQIFTNKVTPEVGEHNLGLGIILIHDFANKNNMSVSVTSKVGGGSCFRLTVNANI